MSDQHSLSYFRIRGHRVATVYFNSNRLTFWEEVKNWFSRWWLWWPFWISNRHDYSYFSLTRQPVATSLSFNLICLVVCEMSKADFQDGGCSGHLRCQINKILAHFNPEVILLLQSKFRFKSTKGLGRDVEN